MPIPVPPPDQTGVTSTTDRPLYWCSYGDTRSLPLLVLHGGPGAHHDYLLPQFLRLSKTHRAFFYDQRGGGRSKSDDSTAVTWTTHVADLGRVATELPVQPLTLVGYSWGALLALLYSLEARRRDDLPAPTRLVLVDPAPIARRYRDAFEEEFQRRQAAPAVAAVRAALLASGLRDSDPPRYRQRLFELGVSGYFADPARSRDLTPFRVTGKVQQSVWESLGEYDLSASLADLRIPSLVVHGRRDPIPLESSETAARALDARFLVLEASGHVPYVEQPDALFTTIAQFLLDTA
ncbi:MAG: Proline iminopeptidase [Gemmatimonadaceae bacterium]|nr:Proline iminopeptidase [Gemmatimonadaceae bacterium]